MSQHRNRAPENRASQEPGLLLDDKQWAYLRKRYELTPRELEIAALVCRGYRNGSIAESLHITPGTVKAHMRNIYRKVRVKSRIRMLLTFVQEAQSVAGSPGLVQTAHVLGPR